MQLEYLLAHIRLRRSLEGCQRGALAEQMQALAVQWSPQPPAAALGDDVRRAEYTRMTTATTRIQAWWRGTQVRNRLAKVSSMRP